MRYWVYINDKVAGPFTEDKLVTLNGFTPDTLICSEDSANSGNQEWVKASTVFEFDEVTPESAAADAATPATAAADGGSDALAVALLAKLDALTNQLNNIQAKMDGMQTKLDESISAQQKASTEAAQRADALAAQVDSFVTSSQEDHNSFLSPQNEDSTPTDENVSFDGADASQLQGFESPTSIDLGEMPQEEPAAVAEAEKPAETPSETTEEPEANVSQPAATSAEPELADATKTTTLSGETEEEAVLNAALTSLHNEAEAAKAPKQPVSNEYVIQDLLHPDQNITIKEEPKKEAPKKEEKQSTSDGAKTPTDAQKEALLAELTAPKNGEEVVDQVIKEKEAEKAKEKGKQSLSQRLIAAGAAAATAAATFVGLKSAHPEPKQEEQKPEKPAQEPAKPVQAPEAQVSAKPQPESQPETDPAPTADIPTLDATGDEPTTSEEPAAEQPKETIEQLSSLADQPMQPMEAHVTEEPVAPQQPENENKIDVMALEEISVDSQQQDIPVLSDMEKPVTPEVKNEEPAAPSEVTMQELVPGAKLEKPDFDPNDPSHLPGQSESLISDKDLKEAFEEGPVSSTANQSVEQLFGLADDREVTTEPQPEQPQPSATDPLLQDLPTLAMGPTPQADVEKEKTRATTNPNELTEIELKEGSTYLISDFVPPASSASIEEAYAKRDGKPLPAEKTKTNIKEKDDNIEIQEFVSSPRNIDLQPKQEVKQQAAPEPAKEQANLNNPEATVTVSQIILENTIKAKRGAALDIKTVPMVPEPAHSDRLQIDGLDDEINAQHDLKSADIQPAGKTARMVVGILITLLLAGVIYGMLGFMELIPAKFNILASKEETVQAEQEAQLNEMLGTDSGGDSMNNVSAQPQDTGMAQQDAVMKEAQDYLLSNGYSLKQYIEYRHPKMVGLITWTISNAVDPDTYSVLVKVPPENPQSFKISYRFNYNAVSRTLEPTTSDARNLLDSIGK
ncbi:MAG: hypothetical protein IKP06_03775 [Elusimicrobiaceae bacterium]|nr:hypothetical protein [Elusimicrobiaceae bacterium]